MIPLFAAMIPLFAAMIPWCVPNATVEWTRKLKVDCNHRTSPHECFDRCVWKGPL